MDTKNSKLLFSITLVNDSYIFVDRAWPTAEAITNREGSGSHYGCEKILNFQLTPPGGGLRSTSAL